MASGLALRAAGEVPSAPFCPQLQSRKTLQPFLDARIEYRRRNGGSEATDRELREEQAVQRIINQRNEDDFQKELTKARNEAKSGATGQDTERANDDGQHKTIRTSLELDEEDREQLKALEDSFDHESHQSQDLLNAHDMNEDRAFVEAHNIGVRRYQEPVETMNMQENIDQRNKNSLFDEEAPFQKEVRPQSAQVDATAYDPISTQSVSEQQRYNNHQTERIGIDGI